jgi:flavin-dependent dehydrogenase
MSIPKKCDVIIIGGGPAGSISSALLSEAGYHVVLLEKQKHPRYMVGESLLPHFWKYTDLIGVSEIIKNEGFISKNGGLVCWDNTLKNVSFKDFGYGQKGLHVERNIFDKILFDRSEELGTEAFENISATSIEFTDDAYSVNLKFVNRDKNKGEIKAKYAIDASGQSAITAKQYNFREFDPDLRFPSFWGYYDKADYLNISGNVKKYESRFEINPATFISGIGD